MFRSRCPRCGERTELVSETWEVGGRLLHVRRCVGCGRETAVETAWRERRPPSATAGGRRRTMALLWLSAVLAAIWIILRVIDYSSRARVYRGVSDALEAFRAPVWIGIIGFLSIVGALWARRGRAAPTEQLLVGHVQLGIRGDDRMVVSVAEGHQAVGQDHILERQRSRETRVLEDFTTLGRRVSRGAGGEAAPAEEETRRALLSIGRELGELMGAGEASGRAIMASRASHMLLRVPTELANLPWELAVLRENSDPLWRLFAVARQAVVPVATPRRSREVALPLRVLLLADLESDAPGRGLPEAAREAAEIMELGAERPDVLRIVRRTPRSAEELADLIGQGFDIIHFAGHGGETRDGSPAWILADGTAVAPAEMTVAPEPPLLVFSNACVPSSNGGGVGGGFAESFLAWGASAYLGPFWDLSDRGGAAFARGFYSELARGATLGAAMQAARRASSAAHSVAWAGYVLYGDPTMAPASGAASRR